MSWLANKINSQAKAKEKQFHVFSYYGTVPQLWYCNLTYLLTYVGMHKLSWSASAILSELTYVHTYGAPYKKFICDCPCKNQPKIEIHFLSQLIATYISYLHSMSSIARLNWSAFLGGGFTTL